MAALFPEMCSGYLKIYSCVRNDLVLTFTVTINQSTLLYVTILLNYADPHLQRQPLRLCDFNLAVC